MLQSESLPRANEEEQAIVCEHPAGKVRLQRWGPRLLTRNGVRVIARYVKWVCLVCGHKAEKIVGYSHCH